MNVQMQITWIHPDSGKLRVNHLFSVHDTTDEKLHATINNIPTIFSIYQTWPEESSTVIQVDKQWATQLELQQTVFVKISAVKQKPCGC